MKVSNRSSLIVVTLVLFAITIIILGLSVLSIALIA